MIFVKMMMMMMITVYRKYITIIASAALKKNLTTLKEAGTVL